MKPHPRIARVLVAVIAGLLLANLVAYVVGRPVAADPEGPGSSASWQRWEASPTDVKLGHIHLYERVSARPDARAVWRAARSFRRLPADQQQTRRDVRGALWETVEAQTSASRERHPSLRRILWSNNPRPRQRVDRPHIGLK